MGIMFGGTIEDFARQEVLINFSFEPKGKKLTLEQIFAQRKSIGDELKPICKSEAERMVRAHFLSLDEDGTYVFSRDNQGSYSWQSATKKDKIANYVYNKFGKYFS